MLQPGIALFLFWRAGQPHGGHQRQPSLRAWLDAVLDLVYAGVGSAAETLATLMPAFPVRGTLCFLQTKACMSCCSAMYPMADVSAGFCGQSTVCFLVWRALQAQSHLALRRLMLGGVWGAILYHICP